MINFTDIVEWGNNNKLVLGLLASAIIITMPEKLPCIRDFPEWLWEWSRDAAKTFFNFRHSGSPVSDILHTKQVALKAELLEPAEASATTTATEPAQLEVAKKDSEAPLEKKEPDWINLIDRTVTGEQPSKKKDCEQQQLNG